MAKYFPPEAVNAALAIMQKESGGDPGIASGYNKGGTEDSHGLFQINLMGHPSMKGTVTDPEANVAYAAKLYADQGWAPWLNAAKALGLAPGGEAGGAGGLGDVYTLAELAEQRRQSAIESFASGMRGMQRPVEEVKNDEGRVTSLWVYDPNIQQLVKHTYNAKTGQVEPDYGTKPKDYTTKELTTPAQRQVYGGKPGGTVEARLGGPAGTTPITKARTLFGKEGFAETDRYNLPAFNQEAAAGLEPLESMQAYRERIIPQGGYVPLNATEGRYTARTRTNDRGTYDQPGGAATLSEVSPNLGGRGSSVFSEMLGTTSERERGRGGPAGEPMNIMNKPSLQNLLNFHDISKLLADKGITDTQTRLRALQLGGVISGEPAEIAIENFGAFQEAPRLSNEQLQEILAPPPEYEPGNLQSSANNPRPMPQGYKHGGDLVVPERAIILGMSGKIYGELGENAAEEVAIDPVLGKGGSVNPGHSYGPTSRGKRSFATGGSLYVDPFLDYEQQQQANDYSPTGTSYTGLTPTPGSTFDQYGGYEELPTSTQGMTQPAPSPTTLGSGAGMEFGITDPGYVAPAPGSRVAPAPTPGSTFGITDPGYVAPLPEARQPAIPDGIQVTKPEVYDTLAPAPISRIGERGYRNENGQLIDILTNRPVWKNNLGQTGFMEDDVQAPPNTTLFAGGQDTAATGEDQSAQIRYPAALGNLQREDELAREEDQRRILAARNNIPDQAAAAMARRQRRATDYRYGRGGLDVPTEIRPPLEGERPRLGTGLRYMIESMADRELRRAEEGQAQRNLGIAAAQREYIDSSLASNLIGLGQEISGRFYSLDPATLVPLIRAGNWDAIANRLGMSLEDVVRFATQGKAPLGQGMAA